MRTTRLRGARTNNLRGVDLDLTPGSLVVVAGPSGAGKSSLAFGTLYAEGQRRYVESFSAYARQFLERLARPPVDELEPVPAGIAVDRQAPVRTSRSTVGTMTEITDYAKGLWARIATLHCPDCDRPVVRDTPQGAAEALLAEAPGAKVVVTYPVHVSDPEQFLGVREALLADGYRRVRVGGEVRDLDEVRPSDVLGDLAVAAASVAARGKKTKKQGARTKRARAQRAAPRETRTLDVVADRTALHGGDRVRLIEALEAAMSRGGGRAEVVVEGVGQFRFSKALECAHCHRSFRDATPGLFSFNSPIGACDTCRGFGRTIGIDWDRVLPDRRKTLAGGAIRAWSGASTDWERRELAKHAKRQSVPLDVPFEKLSADHQKWVIDGDGVGWPKGWWGLRGWFTWMEGRAYRMHVRVFLSRYRKYETCSACGGARVKPDALDFKIDGRTIADFYAMPVGRALELVETLEREHGDDPATALALRECNSRLRTLVDVGLSYLTLDRASRTLSGGEAQRVALAGALGASLTGAMFVLDEPTVGLHPSDVGRLFGVVRRLVSGGNLAIVVEHDPAVIEAADRVVELGPGAGEHGGHVVFDGTPAALRDAATATGRALADATPIARARRKGRGAIVLRGARGNNLRAVELRIPIGALTCVTGVSGSGKSTLVLDTLCPSVARALGDVTQRPLEHDALQIDGLLTGVVHVDQAPLGRTSRGNPATYLKAWDVIRRRFAATPLARERDYGPGYFSFNVPGGRCEACKGEGAETVEMQFLADVTFSCPECRGTRFVGPVLDVRVHGRNVADVLDLTATEALACFAGDRELDSRLRPLCDVGLGYLRLGQPLSTLSGGEAQRLKLAEALAGARPGSLVVLDEPTAGLHATDVAPLIAVLDALVKRGDTVVVVEHDMRLAAHADHLVDLGPGAGEDGGLVVAAGTPEEVAADALSATAPFLREALGAARPRTASERGTGSLAVGETQAQVSEAIHVVGAREHNLHVSSLRVPRGKLCVVTGPSGSGKSTLTFDVIHAEAQRRYLETLSPYARQYLPQLPRPNVDRVTGLPPSVSLEQRVTRGGANSTVATVTEIAHYLRVLYARAGLLHCPDCSVPIAPRQPALLAEDIAQRFGKRTEVGVLAPVVRGRKGHHREILERAVKDGFVEARIDGKLVKLERGLKLARFEEHDVDVLVATLRAGDVTLEEPLRRALGLGGGTARIRAGEQELLVSSTRACPSCGRGFPELDPRFFSFNTRQGACESCEGHGVLERTIGRGRHATIEEYECDACGGTRLSKLARAVTVDSRPITAFLEKSVTGARAELARVRLDEREAEIGRVPLVELEARLAFLEQVGLGYLGLGRAASTLSGGETQRVRLAAQLGSGLTGVLYVLDEPTIGLHPRDTGLLLAALRALVDKGCSVLVVEHDADTIRAADHLIDVGPGGGRQGGHVVAEGSPRELLADPRSITGAAIARPAQVPSKRRPVRGADVKWLELLGASEHNLRDVNLRVPLGRLVAVTGVSGSGKSTLVRDVLLRATRGALGLEHDTPGAHRAIRGAAEALKRAVEVDQSPIGRTPRSVPATYVGVWDEIRRMLAVAPEARARGWTASRFSFNVAEGRCPACEGQGALSVEMAFLPEVLVPCEACGGGRFTSETLDVKLHGASAAELLELDIADAARVLSAIPRVATPLKLLEDLGLGYLKLGQASNTLSGGEAQRLKLVAELGSLAAGPTLYVMDEPTTGLHRDDVARLLRILERLVDRGDTVVVIEHQPDVIIAADWIVDLGPEGGDEGGRIVAEGTPEEVARVKTSHTGAVIRRELQPLKAAAPAAVHADPASP